MLETTVGGRYHIIHHLGNGGFGQTFLAKDLHLPGNPLCVVKQLKPYATDPASLQIARRLFNREAEALYKLKHDRIPQLFAHFQENGEFFLVQEYIEGGDLSREFSQDKWSEGRVVELLQSILEVLAFVHGQGVIHRDLKPSNLVRANKDGRLVLIDFGAVKQVSAPVAGTQGQNTFTVIVGSPGYMPNEQLAGGPNFTSDLYAVGSIGIQALTGLHPNQFSKDPKTNEILWRDLAQVSPRLADILDAMVRYDFRQRFQSATEVLQALADLTGATPLSSVPEQTHSTGGLYAAGIATSSELPTVSVNPSLSAGSSTGVPAKSGGFLGKILFGAGSLAVIAIGILNLTKSPPVTSSTSSGNPTPQVQPSLQSPSETHPARQPVPSAPTVANTSPLKVAYQGKLGDELSTSNWSFQALNVTTTNEYVERYYQEKPIVRPHAKGNTLIVVGARIKNRLQQIQTPVLSAYFPGDTMLIDNAGHSHRPIRYDALRHGVPLSAGEGTDFALVFSVPRGTKPKFLIFTLQTRGNLVAGADVEVLL